MLRWGFVGFIVVGLLCGCATRAGVDDFRIYASAFEEVVEASEPILSRLRVVERERYRQRILQGGVVRGRQVAGAASGILTELYPEHAIYFVEGVDPPITSVIRSSIEAVDSYNKALLLYAEGGSLRSLKTEVDRLRTETTQVLGLFDAGAASAFGDAFTRASPALAAVRLGADSLIRAGSREAFRAELVSRHGEMQTVLDALINSAEPIYAFLAREDIRRLRREDSPEMRARLDATQRMLAEWIVVLQTSKAALNRAVAAAQGDPGAVDLVAGTADLVADIRAGAERIRDLSARAGGV